MANSNQVSLALWEESSYGVLPVGQDLKAIRFTSESLQGRNASTISQEIRSDRQTADVVRTSLSASGSIEGEFSYGSAAGTSSAQDLLLEAALQSSDWAAAVTNTGNWSTSGSNITGTNVSVGIVAGRWVRLKNGSTLLGYHLVTSVPDANTLTVTPAPSALTGSGDEEVEAGGFIKNGTEQRSFSIERAHTDLSGVFEQLAGMVADGWSLSLGTGAINTQSFSFMGKRETSASSTMGDGGNTAHVTNDVMNSIDNVYALREAHASLGAIVRSVSIQTSNNLFMREAIGTLGATGIGSGSFNVSGSMTVYFEDNDLADKSRNWTTTNLTIILQDAAGNAYCLWLPSVKITEAGSTTPGLNGDVTATLSFTAFRSSTYSETLRITRWDA